MSETKEEYIKRFTSKGGKKRWELMTPEQKKIHVGLMIAGRRRRFESDRKNKANKRENDKE